MQAVDVNQQVAAAGDGEFVDLARFNRGVVATGGESLHCFDDDPGPPMMGEADR